MAEPTLPFPDGILKQTVDWRGFRALPWNLPNKRPGSYGLLCLVNGKWYVGIGEVLARRCSAHSVGHSPKKLKAAIAKHDKASFLVVPLYYDLIGSDALHGIEAGLIVDYDAIRSGYNIIEAGGRVGPYGPAFSAAVKATKNTPEGQARQAAAARTRWDKFTPDQKRRFQEGRDQWNAQHGQEISTRVQANWANPEHRALRTETNGRAARQPERRTKVGRGVSAAYTPERKRQAAERIVNTLLTSEAKARANSPQRLIERSTNMRRLWSDPEWREGMLAARQRARKRGPSKH